MSRARSPVAVVIVSWNSERYLASCLDSLSALRRPPAEVVVVDNASSDGSVALVRERHDEVRLIEQTGNIGFCRANNIGIGATESRFVLVLNPDTRLDSRFLEELLPAFDDPGVGLAAGKLLRFDGRTIDSAGQMLGPSRQPIDRGYGCLDEGQLDQDGEVFGACGAAALYRRTMLASVADPGGCYFNEAFFAFFEDLDLAWRARKLGWRAVYRHAAIGYHARGGSQDRESRFRRWAAMLGRSPEIRFHIVKNRYLAILRNDRPIDYVRSLPFVLGRDLATAGLLVLTGPGVFLRLWRERHLFREARALRRLDSERPRHEFDLGQP